MALNVIGATITGGNTGLEPSGTLPGDLLLIYAANISNVIIPTLPAGWSNLGSGTSATTSEITGSIVRGVSVPSFLCSGASRVSVITLRGAVLGFGAAFHASGNSATPTSASIVLSNVYLVAFTSNGIGNITFVPTGAWNNQLISGVMGISTQLALGSAATAAQWSIGAAGSWDCSTVVLIDAPKLSSNNLPLLGVG